MGSRSVAIALLGTDVTKDTMAEPDAQIRWVNPAAVRLALDFAGPDRILAGSDYPHQIGSIPLMIETIRGLDIGDDVKRKIFGANAAALLGLA